MIYIYIYICFLCTSVNMYTYTHTHWTSLCINTLLARLGDPCGFVRALHCIPSTVSIRRNGSVHEESKQ